MKSWFRHPFRVTRRFAWMVAELSFSALTNAGFCAFRPDAALPMARARWLQYSCRRFLRVYGLQARADGPVPHKGLLISNHLSYLDVLVLASITPAVFVSKLEVKHWPVFGWLTRIAGTVYVHRERRFQVGQVTDEIQAALDSGLLVVLFPEGTSSDGTTVLPFKTSLLEPATSRTHPLSVSFVQYELDDGDVGEEVCYWKDMTFFPHLINLFGKRLIRAHVRFAPVPEPNADRKHLARQLHSEVLRLKSPVVAKPAGHKN